MATSIWDTPSSYEGERDGSEDRCEDCGEVAADCECPECFACLRHCGCEREPLQKCPECFAEHDGHEQWCSPRCEANYQLAATIGDADDDERGAA